MDKQHEALSLAGKQVIVRTLRDGRVQVVHRGVKLRWRRVRGRAERATKPAVAVPVKLVLKKPPAANHPWRQQRIGSVRKLAVRRRGACLAVGDSGQPPLRSGRPASPTASHAPRRRTANLRTLPIRCCRHG